MRTGCAQSPPDPGYRASSFAKVSRTVFDGNCVNLLFKKTCYTPGLFALKTLLVRHGALVERTQVPVLEHSEDVLPVAGAPKGQESSTGLAVGVLAGDRFIVDGLLPISGASVSTLSGNILYFEFIREGSCSQLPACVVQCLECLGFAYSLLRLDEAGVTYQWGKKSCGGDGRWQKGWNVLREGVVGYVQLRFQLRQYLCKTGHMNCLYAAETVQFLLYCKATRGTGVVVQGVELGGWPGTNVGLESTSTANKMSELRGCP